MPHQIGHVDNSNGNLAHYNMLATIKDFASTNGWQVLRYDDSAENRELILKGVGFSGEEEIFVGFRTYQNANADFYNLVAAVFTGYVPSNTFDRQPGAYLSGVPAHNRRIDYWLTLNPQRIVLAMKVGTPVYETCYVGKMLPYARPSQYPYPVVCAGMLNGTPSTRFSDTSTNHGFGFKGNSQRLALRTNDQWRNVYCYPWGNAALAGSTQLRDTDGLYPLIPIELHDNTANLWGALDGIFYISGFNNAVENTMDVDGRHYVVMQDVSRTSFTDYVALRMDL
ncbi:hypothetical protein VQ643_04360 [Pseudomonas sp. F1_0610]|uniref:hypothetical protein n=1 Tax=Pseudomonas sp. F1_0610 TaxID=3114284 RepID=UPI0039C259B9